MKESLKSIPALRVGIDIGSTTVKLVVLDQDESILYSRYERHNSDMRAALEMLFEGLNAEFSPDQPFQMSFTGSGGVKTAEFLDVPFTQEVIAETEVVEQRHPEADCILELGGEDAKITFLKPSTEQRMNGTCAGGTGSFIDQMAQLLQTDATGLNTLAKSYAKIYPIASRCGVFAKSDLQPLLNEGAGKEDLAASVFQAVVNQTISGLAQGRRIEGNIIFLGGPLFFLSELRAAFERSLQDRAESFVLPDNAQLYVAIGAALLSGRSRILTTSELLERFEQDAGIEEDLSHIPPLFADEEERRQFDERHAEATVEFHPIESAEGPCFLGIDAGSTTTKAVLLDEEGRIVFQHYGSNKGNPIQSTVSILEELYKTLPASAYLARACVTGYGERMIEAALKIDEGEIETMAHYRAAEYFRPGVDFIIDIGGQDMKCMRVRDGVIDHIMLNEACSSGCGSFLQTFATSVNRTVPEFAQAALTARNPVDLGTRCTVFMNSRVKQAQKEGATVGDISAGLSYSVVRNALYKVIKLQDPDDMGEHVVVQGGTFLNDAVLRSFEQITGRHVTRPNIAGLMGAFGAGLTALRHWDGQSASAVLSEEDLRNFEMKTSHGQCKLCANNCRLTITRFGDGSRFISGNRCERGAGAGLGQERLPNLYNYKRERTFAYESLSEDEAKHGIIGLPRVLNIYENYPFWHTLFTDLGFRVVVSDVSSHAMYEKGMDSIPSESVCYPAKMVHGHIQDLIDKGVKTIFYPGLPYERQENQNADNHFNCPIVVSYPDVIKNNMDELVEENIRYLHPFLPMHNPKTLVRHLLEIFRDEGFSPREMRLAVDRAYDEMAQYKEDLLLKGEETLQWMAENDVRGIVLAGRPYHVDPGIHHGIPEVINDLGLAVFTEDSVARPGKLKRPIRAVDQWGYHSRLYEAAAFVCERPDLELVQLNSFGCGIDAITTDQCEEILESQGRMYTCLKIDEVSNLGAVRIRLRSLKAAMDERMRLGANDKAPTEPQYMLESVPFTKEDAKTHTVLIPQMSPIHFSLLHRALETTGIRFRVLEKATAQDIEMGLKYVNNDACYPTIIVVGQFMNELINGDIDPENTTLLITQTGGGCRATNYVAFIRKALSEAGYPQVPVLALSAQGIETNPGFRYTPDMLHRAMRAIVVGDLLMKMLYRVRPYEVEAGAADKLYKSWDKRAGDFLGGVTREASFKDMIRAMVDDFNALPLRRGPRKPRVGVVGEILVKYHPDANNDVVGVIETEGCEAVVPGLMDFLLYCAFNAEHKWEAYGNSRLTALGGRLALRILETYRAYANRCLAATDGKFDVWESIDHKAELAAPILNLGNATGEGWFLTAEMVELIQTGAPNIICVQPFACLPNHVVGKGMVKELRRRFPESNIVPIDYDPGASEVNQLNRIKLMVSTALKRHEEKHGDVNELRQIQQVPVQDLRRATGATL